MKRTGSILITIIIAVALFFLINGESVSGTVDKNDISIIGKWQGAYRTLIYNHEGTHHGEAKMTLDIME